ncbi:hypothetical protein CPB86DRAFT_761569 [Serendipita vermifera]|nr:hypothetical protein CPB86DRAFT_761569 [Serendipita vermifera]
MSRIDKGGTKFRPMMPKVTHSEKPRSSTAPRSKGPLSTTLAPPIESRLPVSTDVDANDQISSSQNEGEALQNTEAERETMMEENLANQSETPSTGQRLDNIPTSTALNPRGNAISMPGERRIPASSTGTLPIPSVSQEPSTVAATVSELTSNQVEEPTVNREEDQPRSKRKMSQPRQDPVEEEVESPRKRRRTSTAMKADAPRPSRSTKARSKPTPSTTQGEEAVPIAEDSNSAPRENDDAHSASESDEEEGTPVRRRRKPRPRVDKQVFTVPEEGDPIDETMVTMRDLCNGMGQGRVSGRYLETFVKSNEDTKRKREENAKLREMARRKELGLAMDDEEMRRFDEERRFVGPPLSLVQRANSLGDEVEVEMPGNTNGVDSDDEYAGVVRTTTRAPQIRYNQDEIVLDETQMQYDRQAEADAELASRGPVEVIIETDRDKFTNFASFPRKPRPDRWSKEETETFYLGLRMFHTGFDLIARLLPNRTRTMVRNKFRAEDKKNPQKITHLLSNKMRLPYDLELLSRETGHDFSGPIPQVDIVNPIETSKEGEESDKEEEDIKLRQSTAPPSGIDSDRGEGTSISTNRGRQVSKGKEKRRSSKSSKPRSSSGARNDSQGVVLHTGNTGKDKPEETTSRPPAINPVSSQKVPVIRSVTSLNGGKLIMPGVGRSSMYDE